MTESDAGGSSIYTLTVTDTDPYTCTLHSSSPTTTFFSMVKTGTRKLHVSVLIKMMVLRMEITCVWSVDRNTHTLSLFPFLHRIRRSPEYRPFPGRQQCTLLRPDPAVYGRDRVLGGADRERPGQHAPRHHQSAHHCQRDGRRGGGTHPPHPGRDRDGPLHLYTGQFPRELPVHPELRCIRYVSSTDRYDRTVRILLVFNRPFI